MQIAVNGLPRDVPDQPERSLLVVLREELGLTAAKYGCGEGACGACTVLVDGRAVRSCTLPLRSVGGGRVTTLEGLADDAVHERLEAAFGAHGASQCGFCTPGMLVSATALLRADPAPNEDAIVAAMDGNLCRCGTYRRILDAIAAAAQTGQSAGKRPSPEGLPTVKAFASDGSESVDAATRSRPDRPWDLTPTNDRDWFGILGNGLVVVLEPDESERILRATGRGWSTPGGVWIHVRDDGRVVAFTGKVDVGQRNRSALALLVATELGVHARDVVVEMGDTDLCPEDLGTFGSRSIADAGTQLSAAAREARRVLIELAASMWEASVADLQVLDGAVVSRDGARRARFGGLIAGCRMVERARWDGAPASPPIRAGVGTLVPAAIDMRYTSDLGLPGMLHGRVLKPPAFGARLRSVELGAARSVDGAQVVHEGEFVGVAASDPTTAARALDAVQATWDPPGNSASDADLEAWLRAHPVAAEGWEGSVDRSIGDVETALSKAVITSSATYRTAAIAHVPLETRAAVAEWTPDGRVTVWTGTQRPFGVRAEVADALGVGEERVRIIVAPTGSGYGGKHSGDAAVEAARLARFTGRPVKVRWSRAEEFSSAYSRPATVIDIRSGLDSEGRIVAWEMCTLNAGANALATPYDVPNQHLAYQPTAAPLRQGSYRAIAATANSFAREVQMDELAEAAGADPLAFRLAHLSDARLAAVLRAAAAGGGWSDRAAPSDRERERSNTAEREGIGIAGGIEKDGRIATCVRVRVTADDQVRVTRIVSAYDCGRIVDRDNLANQVAGAAVMGLGGALFERIEVDHGRVRNASLAGYRVPRFSDVPPIDVELLDQPTEPSAGAGETPIIAIGPAIANAITNATGRRLRSLPLLGRDGRIAD